MLLFYSIAVPAEVLQQVSVGLGGISLKWRFPSPLNMVLKTSLMESYTYVARFLLQATYAKELCQGLYYGTHRTMRSESPTLWRQLSALYFFSRALHDYLYFQCATSGGGLNKLIKQLKKSKNIGWAFFMIDHREFDNVSFHSLILIVCCPSALNRHMEQVFATHLSTLEEHCLLSPTCRTLHSYLCLLLDLVARFCLIHQQAPDSGGEEMTEVYRTFLRHFTHVIALLEHLISSRLAPFVEDLRLRLDFDGFFGKAPYH